MKQVLMALSAVLVVSSVATAQHYALGPDWVAGEGVYTIVDDDGNRILVGAAANGADPKHAWVNQQFGNSYTVKCDIRMETWDDAEDLSRAGIAVQINPDGTAADGGGDRGINLLLHDTLGNVEFLSDLRGWGTDTAFEWATDVWYTMELSVDNGVVNGSIMTTDGSDTVTLAEWSGFPGADDRVDGFPGVTASTRAGLSTSFDNFEVIVDGNVVFSDDFEGTAPVKSTVGLSADWVGGEGFYVVDEGVLVSIATNGADPKHAWVDQQFGNSYTVKADIRMETWDDAEDLSRAGIAVQINPDGTAADGGGDRGINLLLHDTLGNVEFLSDLRGWGTDTAFEWATDVWYTMELSVDNGVVNGSIMTTDGSDTVTLAEWSGFPGADDRVNGFPGVTGSTRAGLIASFDNFEVIVGGETVFSDDFEVFVSESEGWSLYK